MNLHSFHRNVILSILFIRFPVYLKDVMKELKSIYLSILFIRFQLRRLLMNTLTLLAFNSIY